MEKKEIKEKKMKERKRNKKKRKKGKERERKEKKMKGEKEKEMKGKREKERERKEPPAERRAEALPLGSQRALAPAGPTRVAAEGGSSLPAPPPRGTAPRSRVGKRRAGLGRCGTRLPGRPRLICVFKNFFYLFFLLLLLFLLLLFFFYIQFHARLHLQT